MPNELLDAADDINADEGTVPPSTDTPEPPDATPEKKAGPIRIWGLLLLPILLAIIVVVLEFALAPFIASTLRSNLAQGELQLDDNTTVGASLLGGSIRIDALNILNPKSNENPQPYSADEITVDLGVSATLFGKDYVIERLAARKTFADLRRNDDGTVPGVDDDVLPPPEPGEPIDWLSMWEKTEAWRKRFESWDWQLGRNPEQETEPEPEQPELWPEAVFYPAPPAPKERSPRVFIQELEISGDRIIMPDAVAANGDMGALDITQYSVNGANVALYMLGDESMSLQAQATTHAAGSLNFDLTRTASDGSFRLGWDQLPLGIIASEEVAGSRLKQYGLSGLTTVALTLAWNGERIDGNVTLAIEDFAMQPTAAAEREAHQIAKQLKTLPIKTFVWEIGITGTLTNPQLTGGGIKGLAEAVLRALKDPENIKTAAAAALKDERVSKEIDKLEDKIPDEHKGTADAVKEKAGDILKDIKIPGL